MPHVCSWYCHEDIHVISCLMAPDVTESELRQMYTNMGLTVLQIRRAPEADIDTWRRTLTEEVATDGRRQAAPPGGRMAYTEPWLVFVRKRPDA